MSSKQKVKGNGYEREIVKLATEKGLDCSRSWGSDGRSRGLSKDVDIVLENYNVQCKRIKRLPKWLGMTDDISIVLTREDQGETYAIMRLEKTDGLLGLLNRVKFDERGGLR